MVKTSFCIKLHILEIVIILCLFMMMLGCSGTDHLMEKPDQHLSTKQIVKGRLVGFATGDYVHAVIELEGGNQESYWLFWGMDYFLALHKNEPLSLTCQTTREFIREAGEQIVITKIVSAKAGNQTFEQWLKTVKSTMTDEAIDLKYNPLVNELELITSP